ncbi:MAG: single-stranded DNA-binding protein [Planctomycetes bacterium]|nr:single-stranded DNA-binding protein [Planctomycetota bacterium]
MANFNRVIMLGNLTRDPQLSYLPSQTPVVEFGLATNRKWTGQDGSQREETCFVDCRAFGRQAETINKYCSKGRPLLIEGRLTYDQWETPEGAKRSKHRITVQTFTFVGSRSGGGENSGGASAPPISEPAPSDVDTGPPPDDIPF